MSVTFNNVQELEEYFRYLEETIHDDERRLVLRGIAIARNLYIFSEYRKRQARLRAAWPPAISRPELSSFFVKKNFRLSFFSAKLTAF